MNVNLNDTVTVVLTATGAEILNEYNAKWSSHPGCREPTTYSANDTHETQLWDLCNIFGSKLYLGCDTPFLRNVISINDAEHTKRIYSDAEVL